MKALDRLHVRWLRDETGHPPALRRCLGCGVESRMPPVVEATDVVDPGLYRRFVRCGACGTYLLDPMEMPDYGGVLAGRLAPDPYIEIGAGVDFIGMLLSAVPASRRSSARLVDVGCAVGFSVHLWRSLGRDGLGVEPSALGKAGAERLQVPMVHGFAGSALELEGRQFDVVLSSEVVEHVPEPADFLRILASLREPGGLVILSTPDTRPLDDPDPDDLDAWEVLSPGFHTCVLSEAALRKLCVDAGLPAVRIERAGGHLVCIAGEDVADAIPDSVGARREYGEYLRREAVKGYSSPSVRDGLAFRHFQHLMNAGEWKTARSVRDRLARALGERYGEDVTNPRVCRRRGDAISGARDIGRHVPWFVLELHHALGILEVAGHGSIERARDHFAFVAELAPRLASLDPTYLPTATSYAYNALYQSAAVALSSGSVAEMEAFLGFEKDFVATHLGFAPGREILALAAADLFKNHILARRFEAARPEEERLRRLLSRALRIPRFDLAALAASIRSDPRAPLEKEALVQAAASSAFAMGRLRLEGDRRPADAVALFDAILDLLDAQRVLPSGPAFAGALGADIRRERDRALRSLSRPTDSPDPNRDDTLLIRKAGRRIRELVDRLRRAIARER